MRMEKTNGLSRRLDQKIEVIKDNQFYKLEKVVIDRPKVNIVKKIKKKLEIRMKK